MYQKCTKTKVELQVKENAKPEVLVYAALDSINQELNWLEWIGVISNVQYSELVPPKEKQAYTCLREFLDRFGWLFSVISMTLVGGEVLPLSREAVGVFYSLTRQGNRELRKLWHMKVTVIHIVIGSLGTINKGSVKGTGRVGNQRTSGDHPDYSIITIGQNTEKSPGNRRRLTVAKTPVKTRQLTFVWKTHKCVKL